MYDALGLRFTLRCKDADLRTHLTEILSGLEAADDASDDPPLEFGPSARGATSPDAATLFMGMVNLKAVDAAKGSLLLHAGAVSRPYGGSMILCGPSGSGKSTLTAVLSSRYAYLTDETACLDPYGLRITPFRKPLALKPGAVQALPHLGRPSTNSHRYSTDRYLIPPDLFGGPPPATQPLLPELTVFPTWSPGGDVEVEEVSPSECAYLLGASASHLESVHGGPLSALARLARRTPAYRMRFDDPRHAVAVLDDLWDRAA